MFRYLSPSHSLSLFLSLSLSLSLPSTNTDLTSLGFFVQTGTTPDSFNRAGITGPLLGEGEAVVEFAKDEMSESYTCTNLHGNNQWAKHGTMTNATAVKMCQCHYSLGQNTESYEGAMALVRRVAAEKLDGFIGTGTTDINPTQN